MNESKNYVLFIVGIYSTSTARTHLLLCVTVDIFLISTFLFFFFQSFQVSQADKRDGEGYIRTNLMNRTHYIRLYTNSLAIFDYKQEMLSGRSRLLWWSLKKKLWIRQAQKGGKQTTNALPNSARGVHPEIALWKLQFSATTCLCKKTFPPNYTLRGFAAPYLKCSHHFASPDVPVGSINSHLGCPPILLTDGTKTNPELVF